MFNRVVLEINLKHIKNNLKSYQRAVAPAELMVVVKAHGYGIMSSLDFKVHTEPLLGIYQDLGIKHYAVSNVTEALYLKQLFFKKKLNNQIILLGSFFPEEVHDLIKENIEITITDVGNFEIVAQAAKYLNKTAQVQLLVDTGMGRLGIPYAKAKILLKNLLTKYQLSSQKKYIKINGMFSHLANAHLQNDRHTLKQINLFKELRTWTEQTFPELTLGCKFHLANSWGGGNYPASHHDIVRIGIGQYGVEPNEMKLVKVKPAVQLKSFLISKRRLPVGHCISYDCSYRLPKSTWVGTVAAGYADGIPLSMSSTPLMDKENQSAKNLINGWVLIQGKKFPVIGKVTMDYVMVDLGNSSKVTVGDQVIFFGQDGKKEITVNEFAKCKKTHGYEVLCAISLLRVKREYKY